MSGTTIPAATLDAAPAPVGDVAAEQAPAGDGFASILGQLTAEGEAPGGQDQAGGDTQPWLADSEHDPTSAGGAPVSLQTALEPQAAPAATASTAALAQTVLPADAAATAPAVPAAGDQPAGRTESPDRSQRRPERGEALATGVAGQALVHRADTSDLEPALAGSLDGEQDEPAAAGTAPATASRPGNQGQIADGRSGNRPLPFPSGAGSPEDGQASPARPAQVLAPGGPAQPAPPTTASAAPSPAPTDGQAPSADPAASPARPASDPAPAVALATPAPDASTPSDGSTAVRGQQPSGSRGRMTAGEVVDWIRGLVRVARGDGFASARISLAPPELGQLEIRLTVRAGRVVADIAADTADAVQALGASSADLRRSLEASGLVVQDVNVTQTGPEGRSPTEGRADGEAGAGSSGSERAAPSAAPEEGEPVTVSHLTVSTSTVDVLA